MYGYSRFDTGDNLPLDYNGLKRAGIELMHHEWQISGHALADRTGKAFTVFMEHAAPACRISLVAKPSTVWNGIVSTQTRHLERLAEEKVPLVMHVEERGCFFWFDPLEVLVRGEADNQRFGVEMWNYPVDLGYPWNPSDGVEEALKVMFQKRVAAVKLRRSRL